MEKKEERTEWSKVTWKEKHEFSVFLRGKGSPYLTLTVRSYT